MNEMRKMTSTRMRVETAAVPTILSGEEPSDLKNPTGVDVVVEVGTAVSDG